VTDPSDDDLPCRELVGIITEYLEDALPAPEKARLEGHLAKCAGCAVVLDQFRTTIAVTGRLGQADVDALDARARGDLLATFRQWAAERPTG
jgi:anti-sigma factor RsiW